MTYRIFIDDDETLGVGPNLRELTAEQYAQGFVVPGGWRVPFGPILRKTDHGTVIVKEPTPGTDSFKTSLAWTAPPRG